jgi:hypothetical protein
MHYIKSLARSAYESVIVDEFLEPISTEEVCLIMQRYNKLRDHKKLVSNGIIINGTSI